MTIYIYTYSGIRSPKPQKGKVAYRLVAENEVKGSDGLKHAQVVKDTGIMTAETEGTWNEAALTAVLMALKELKEPIGCKWFIYTDSLYFETNWAKGFERQKNKWLKSDGTRYAYAEQWWDEITRILNECTRPIVSRGDHIYTQEMAEAVKAA